MASVAVRVAHRPKQPTPVQLTFLRVWVKYLAHWVGLGWVEVLSPFSKYVRFEKITQDPTGLAWPDKLLLLVQVLASRIL